MPKKPYAYIEGICNAIDRFPEIVKDLVRGGKLSEPPFVLLYPVKNTEQYPNAVDSDTGAVRAIIELVTTAERNKMEWSDVCDWDGAHSSEPNKVRYFLFSSQNVESLWMGKKKVDHNGGKRTAYAIVTG